MIVDYGCLISEGMSGTHTAGPHQIAAEGEAGRIKKSITLNTQLVL